MGLLYLYVSKGDVCFRFLGLRGPRTTWGLQMESESYSETLIYIVQNFSSICALGGPPVHLIGSCWDC
jgi:hypothetical protein